MTVGGPGCHGGVMFLAAQPPTAFDDYVTISNAIRLLGVSLGFALALVSTKAAYLALREPRDWERAANSMAFGLLAVSPAIPWLYRFDEPLFIPNTITYMAALGFGLVAITYRMTLHWKWWHRLMGRFNRDDEDGEDESR